MAGVLTAAIAAAFAGGVTPDPYFEYTTLLLPGNGTNGAQNNTFLDGSTNNFTITRNGNTTQGTFSPFSQTGWGNYFDGSGDYLSAGSNSAFAFGTGAYTVELWVYPSSISQQVYVVNDTTNGSVFYFETSGSVGFTIAPRGGSAIVYGGYSSLIINTWNHIVFVRGSTAANQTSIFVNGTRVANGTDSTNWTITGPCLIGGLTNNTYMLSGYLSNTRIVKGSAVYDPTQTTITVPTAPLTAISGTSLLTCQSNRFKDNSTNNFAITKNGDTRVVAFSPFNPTASWSAATYGGSGYFDGSGDYLSMTLTGGVGSGNFTIEYWFYPTSLYNYITVFSTTRGSTGLNVGTDGSGLLIFYSNGVRQISAGTIVANQWHHAAFVRNGTTLTAYLNGTSVGTATVSTNFSATAATIGGLDGNSETITGYLSNLRITNTAVYTSNFTPNTTPLTAISGTSLLTNFTNAGIYDATSKNDLETVGNAQISTTQSKWGGSSISFDGTGDWLLIPDQPPQRIGTGNFTVEMWVYRNSSGTYGLAGKGTGTTGWLVSLNSSNQVVFTYGSSTITSSGTVSATTWTHIAVVREGTSTNQTKIYISGTNDGTGTVSTDFNQTNSMYIGADRTGGSAANAYVQDVRITNYARYTGNFTPPTAAFPTL